MTEGRPMPHPTAISEPHWQGAREHRLMVQRCGECGAYVFPPRAACTHCFSSALRWEQSSGLGDIYSYTIIHRAPHPSFEAPYCAAIIRLAEGWHMTSNVIGTPMDEIEVGMPVEVIFVDFDEVTLPMFRVRRSAGERTG